MKKGNLLASTALVSAALAMAAGSADAVTLKLGGFAEFWVGYADNDKAAGVNGNFDVKTDAEIYFTAEEKLDNGITVGFWYELEAGQGNALGSGPPDAIGHGTVTADDTAWDESFGFVKTRWGQINAGNNDVAAVYMGNVRVVGPVGLFKTDAGDWIPGSHASSNNDIDLGLGDSQNVTYFTPRVAGFQFIGSYTPDNSEHAEGDFDEQETAGLHNGFSGALKFDRKFGNVGVSLGAGYTTVEAGDGSTRADRGPDSAEGYGMSGRFTIGPATLSAAYQNENTISFDDDWLAFAALWKVNKMHSVSLGYSTATRDDHVSAGDNRETDLVTAGWSMNMGNGASFNASIFRIDSETPSTTTTSDDRDGWGVVGGMRLTF